MRKRNLAILAILVALGSAAALFFRGGETPGGPRAAGAPGARAGTGGGEDGGGFGPGGGPLASGAAGAAAAGGARPIARGSGSPAGATIAGTVLNPDGKPLRGAIVRARLETAKGPGQSGATGDDGAYAIGPLEGGVYLVEARAPGLRVETLAGIVVRPGEHIRGVDFVLDRGERVLGTVVDPDGAPVPDAQVAARPLGAGRDADPEAAAKSGADGAFDMTGLTLGKKELTATAKGFRKSEPVMVEVIAGAAARVEIRLERGAFIAGRVTDAAKQPLAGLRVEALPEGGGGPFGGGRRDGGNEDVTGPDGRYRIEGLAGRRFRVTAYPGELDGEGGLAPASRGGVRPNVEDCDLVLEKGGLIAGIVVAVGEKKEPVEGASVAINERGFRAGATTAADGTFTLGGVPPGKWALKASAPERAPVEKSVEVGPGERKEGVLIELAAGGVIEGRVVTAKDGRPLQGAIVRVLSGGGAPGGNGRRGGPGPGPGRGGPGEEMLVEALASGADFGDFVSPEQLADIVAKNAVTDSRGRFRIGDLPTGEQRVYAAHADYPGAGARASIDRPGEKKEVEIALPEGGGIAGKVTGAGGAPRADEPVVAFSFAGRVRTAKTDARGEYAIRGLAPGAYFVSLGVEMRARMGGRGGAPRVDAQAQSGGLGFTAKTANVEAGREARVDFGAEAQAIVSGRVTRGDAPVADQSVQFFPDGNALGLRGVQTDADGRYRVELAPGKYMIRVENLSEPIEVPPDLGRLEHDLRLPQGALAGRTVNAATGEPVRARVSLYRAERSGSADSLAGVLGALAGEGSANGADGAFRIDGLAPGLYTVIARADGFAAARVDGVEVPPDGIAHGIELLLEPGGIFRGRVVDERGEPVPGAAIWIVDVAAKDIPGDNPPRADEEGRFEIKRFAPGRYRVTVISEQFAPWRQIVDFPGGAIELAPIMTPGGTLEVDVAGPGGAPLAGAVVDLRYPDGDRVITGFIDFVQPAQPTGPDGKLRRPRLPPGPLEGTVSVPGTAPPRSATFQTTIVDKAEQRVGVVVP